LFCTPTELSYVILYLIFNLSIIYANIRYYQL